MPILYIAIGRRLGYPLKLVHAHGHDFVRWDEPGGERFNIDATSPGFHLRPTAITANGRSRFPTRNLNEDCSCKASDREKN